MAHSTRKKLLRLLTGQLADERGIATGSQHVSFASTTLFPRISKPCNKHPTHTKSMCISPCWLLRNSTIQIKSIFGQFPANRH